MIRVEDDGAIRTLVLDRPHKANALTEAMLVDLTKAVLTAPGHGLILTGTGKVFSAGADLDEVQAGALATSPAWEDLSTAVAAFHGLSIAVLNGTLAGGAFGMALAADLRITSPEARFFYPVAKMGVLPQPSDPRRMAALIGPARTKLILMAGQKLTADVALSYGLVDEIDAAPLERARALAVTASEADPKHLAAIKALIPS